MSLTVTTLLHVVEGVKPEANVEQYGMGLAYYKVVPLSSYLAGGFVVDVSAIFDRVDMVVASPSNGNFFEWEPGATPALTKVSAWNEVAAASSTALAEVADATDLSAATTYLTVLGHLKTPSAHK